MAFSHSGLTLYDQCPSAFYRRYIIKEVAPAQAPHPKAVRGKEVHQNFEDYLNGDAERIENEFAGWKGLLDMLVAKHASAELEFGISAEWGPCEFDAKEAMLRGKIDASYTEEGAAHLYEWKTGRSYPEHNAQRQLYALAALCLFPEVDKVVISTPYLDMKQGPENPKRQEYMRGQLMTLKWIYERKVAKVQPPQEYMPTPSWKCRFCDYSKTHNGGKCCAG